VATVKIDLVDGHRATLTRRGWENVDRLALVSGVTGSAHERLKAAADALAELEPAIEIGAEHPSLPNLYLERIEPEALATDTAKLRLVYQRPEAGRSIVGETLIETGATLAEVETNVDIDGTVMEVLYVKGGTSYRQGGTVSVARPQRTLVITRTEADDPDAKADGYVGHLNESPWRGHAAKTVRCNAIVGTSRDGGDTYQVRYEFERGSPPHYWKKTIVYRDPETGRPPDDLVEGLGIKHYEQYPLANFGLLGLPAT